MVRRGRKRVRVRVRVRVRFSSKEIKNLLKAQALTSEDGKKIL